MTRLRGSDSYDAVIIGGGIGGLTAAAYLARGKARVLLLEASARFGGQAETLEFAAGFRAPLLSHIAYALDWRSVRELRLAKYGLEFVQANMKLVALRPGGKHIVFPAEGFRDGSALAAQAGPDGRAFVAFPKEAMRMARLLRPLWEGTLEGQKSDNPDDVLVTIARRLRLNERDAERLRELSCLSAAAYLDLWFENDALKAALAFSVFPSGLSPQEAGSALVLLWRYAQESCGRQGAVSQIWGGPGALAAALEAAARDQGAQLRSSVRVNSIIVEKRRAKGVTLTSGEIIAAEAVLSSLDKRETLLNLVPPGAIGFGTAMSVPPRKKIATAQLMLALKALPPFAGLERNDLFGRLLIAERPEIAAEAKGAALTAVLPDELVIEATIPTAADPALAPPGGHVLSALLPYMPASVAGGWEAQREPLRKRALATLEWFAPGLKDRVVAHRVVTPDDLAERTGGGEAESASPFSRLLMSYEARIKTPIARLYLCGRAAEPVSVMSGRAGRLAAGLVFTAGGGSRGAT